MSPEDITQSTHASLPAALLGLTAVGHAHVPGAWLFRGIDLQLHRGSRLAIQGASGSGKSTLLNILAGLETPTEGALQWAGEETSAWSEERRRSCRQSEMGFVFQAFHLLMHLTALQNVMVPCLLNGESYEEAQAAAGALLGELGMDQRLNASPSTLSGGEQQRVALARALVHRPAVVFADEPTGNLDAKTSSQALSLLIRLCDARQTSLVMVTHSDEAARSMDRVLRLTAEGLV
jgi:putative ABC transport system ATP-binding protein